MLTIVMTISRDHHSVARSVSCWPSQRCLAAAQPPELTTGRALTGCESLQRERGRESQERLHVSLDCGAMVRSACVWSEGIELTCVELAGVCTLARVAAALHVRCFCHAVEPPVS